MFKSVILLEIAKVMSLVLVLLFLCLLGNERTILAPVKNLAILITNTTSPKLFFFPSNTLVLVFHTGGMMTS